MENLNFLLRLYKKDLINLIIVQITNECGKFDKEDLRKRLNKEHRYLLLYIIIKSVLDNTLITEEIKIELNYIIKCDTN